MLETSQAVYINPIFVATAINHTYSLATVIKAILIIILESVDSISRDEPDSSYRRNTLQTGV